MPSELPRESIPPLLAAALVDRYRIERELGTGGMATVYLAHDIKHDRKVAVKVLKPELAAVLGAERFVVEIKTTASLQHPHILPLFDSGSADGFLYYVMPYIEGETLRDRLNRETQLGVDDAVRLAREVADALDYAHRHHVIHRDIKPENILLHDGRPMVADFGIALAVSAAAGGRMTETGLSLGTPHYMSPEQATAEKEISARSDIYAIGCVLYEMLAGNPPHTGASAQQIIMKIITDPAEAVTKYRKSVPPNVAAAVAKALEKLPADRFETAAKFADALGSPSYTNASMAGRAAGAAAPSSRRVSVPLAAAVAVAVLALLGWGRSEIATRRDAASDAGPVLRFAVAAPSGHAFFDNGLGGTNVAISPRGNDVAFISVGGGLNGTLWVRHLDQLESQALAPPGAPRGPCFSPDGRWIAFSDGIEVKKVAVEGGPVVTLATLPEPPQGLSWSTSGFVAAAAPSNGLFVIPEHGGTPRLLAKPADEAASRFPLALPDGKTIAYSAVLTDGASPIRLASVADGKRTTLDVPGGPPLAVLSGQLIYATRAGFLMAVPFDGKRVSADAPVPLVGDVFVDPLGGAKAAVSSSGALIYRSGRPAAQPVLVGARVSPLPTPPQYFLAPRFSPDSKRIAFTVSTTATTDIWVFDRERTTLTRITTDGVNQRPEWTPDGKRLLFVSLRAGKSGIWWQPADGSGPAELLYDPPQGDPFEAQLSPDGQWLVYRTGPAGTPPRNIFAVRLDGDRKSIPVVTGPGYIQMPRISPDGRWLAYQSNETGISQIYVRPFPGAGGRIQVSSGGGTEPLWGQAGRRLYYRIGNDVIGVPVTTGASLGLGERTVVLTGEYVANPSHPNYDVSPSGTEILMLRAAGDEVRTIIVNNWAREVAAKTAPQGRP